MQNLSALILRGEKTTTWRIFDDKNLQIGDKLQFLVKETSQHFANAIITSVLETTFEKIKAEHLDGHEKYSSAEEMYLTYSKYYGKTVDKNTVVKIIKFKLLK